ncbi:hypothetical protein [Pseudonocardia oroxyli]|uniref:Uncharacterized protein n=1 Tax=Pseudonocardia oroxyli TaxID=366584 RepID=A0A1G8BES2_PSEOR|nr:hypothetical protein [Pseudonocardia oroxyli]SDH31717.1 hypothetical protein SAMN05216377_12118 [Pseudonocardia oroxyli]
MSRRVLVSGLAAIGVLVVAAVLFLLFGPGPTGGPGVGQTTSFTAQQATALQDALGSGDPQRASQAVALADGDELDPTFVREVAALALTIDPSSVSDDNGTDALVRATAGGKSWLLHIRRGGELGWQIVSTAPVP